MIFKLEMRYITNEHNEKAFFEVGYLSAPTLLDAFHLLGVELPQESVRKTQRGRIKARFRDGNADFKIKSVYEIDENYAKDLFPGRRHERTT